MIAQAQEKVLECYIMPLPQLGYLNWLIHFQEHKDTVDAITLMQSIFIYIIYFYILFTNNWLWMKVVLANHPRRNKGKFSGTDLHRLTHL